MANPRSLLIARIMLASAVIAAVVGVYFAVVNRNYVVGGALIMVAAGDVAAALVFSRRA